ncbi:MULTISPECIES: sigma-70 family RNA polymerase sigma factor [Actinokineospora]|uniref:RNA polymerase sigma factor n=1 Tax=Actinokineospora fastidiosa TaxID=1816 RepID=A0A918GNU3_9PSEU|nr:MULTISPECIES: sigma-70 family RNA polymerase sigma factor [Actinokineospora]UVS78115.1 putative RNA polymerase sigma-C factor [Actinokineospora sp. UTMC 2448]GGS49579.1 RNA polymerase sigma factor [Actinokineospora fastidiosa]
MGGAESRDADITCWALAARHGDSVARDRFVRATQQDVWRFVAHLVEASAADDLTQETYLRALRALPRFSGQSSARTWLLSIARRVAVDHYRATRTRPRTADLDDWQAAADRTQPLGLPGFDDGVALDDLLATLIAERRTAFVLTQAMGLTYEEAAEICRCPVGTIRSRVARAREHLMALLRDAEDIPGGR